MADEGGEAFNEVFDVVVVGGGSAGCVVAARLSENPAVSVCLIEAGGADWNWRIQVPVAFPWVVGDPRLNWGFETEAEPALNDRRIAWPRGRVMGGSGAINGLVFLRGLPSDFDDWGRQGARGWAYGDVLPYFRRCEHNVARADAWRGQGGPVTVSDIATPSRPARAFVAACEQLGYPRNPDFNGATGDGVGFTQLNVRHGRRCGPDAAYLRPAARRRNLKLMTRSVVRRVLLLGREAVGVEVEQAGRIQRIGARAEVILCGGAVNSPVLLLASGIGPGEELSALGGATVCDLPGVGKNLQDHFLILYRFRAGAPGTLNEIVQNPLLFLGAALDWGARGRGPFAVGGTEAALFARSGPSEAAPDIQFQCANFSNASFEGGLQPWPGFMSCFYACRPKSRGEVRLADPAGQTPPRIHANYLTHPDDLRVTREAYRIAERIFATDPMRALIAERLSPPAGGVAEAWMDEHMRQEGTTGNHPCGTARIGVDAMAVVDPELKVRGVGRLRVIDAAVMPTIPSSNIHAAAIMIAEKGADLVARSLRGLSPAA